MRPPPHLALLRCGFTSLAEGLRQGKLLLNNDGGVSSGGEFCPRLTTLAKENGIVSGRTVRFCPAAMDRVSQKISTMYVYSNRLVALRWEMIYLCLGLLFAHRLSSICQVSYFASERDKYNAQFIPVAFACVLPTLAS